MTLYQVPGTAVHSPDGIDWSTLPPDCVLQLHWKNTSDFVKFLEEQQFRVVSVARHPLDTLISVLQFSLRDYSTSQWLLGEGGGEESIYGAMPCSSAFLEWACGIRAKTILSITTGWWALGTSARIRYEDLVLNPVCELEGLVDMLGMKPRVSFVDAIEANTLAQLRVRTTVQHHFWQGKFGLWKALLPEQHAKTVERFHPSCFADLGYDCDADPGLTIAQADANWVSLTGLAIAKDLQELGLKRTEVILTQAELAKLKDELDNTINQLGSERKENEALRHALAAANTKVQETLQLLDRTGQQLTESRCEVAKYSDLTPANIAAIRRLKNMARNHPQMAALAKRAVRTTGVLKI
jgi:hypothetical protein